MQFTVEERIEEIRRHQRTGQVSASDVEWLVGQLSQCLAFIRGVEDKLHRRSTVVGKVITLPLRRFKE